MRAVHGQDWRRPGGPRPASVVPPPCKPGQPYLRDLGGAVLDGDGAVHAGARVLGLLLLQGRSGAAQEGPSMAGVSGRGPAEQAAHQAGTAGLGVPPGAMPASAPLGAQVG